MLAQRDQLRALADTTGMVLLHGSELNIAPHGSVDWDEDFLSGFDISVASIHSSFEQDQATMTKRSVAAAENPRVNIIGHPLTRKYAAVRRFRSTSTRCTRRAPAPGRHWRSTPRQGPEWTHRPSTSPLPGTRA